MDHEAYDDQRDQHEQEQGEDEEGGLFAVALGGLGDAEGVDEGVGEEVEERQGSIIAEEASRPASCTEAVASELHADFCGLARRVPRGYTEIGLNESY